MIALAALFVPLLSP
ncbi:Protein of unknown function [Bacillus wiedmannii]|uniref:Uncharacterized protein n=1 Tax=Bacillus wiedmannii TaxID=1890302 RepID=A0AB37YQ93_9BACI|nr:Protein of unknown function [Bacillus wiedmannii]